MESHSKQVLIESLRLSADHLKQVEELLFNAQLTGGDRRRLELLRGIIDWIRESVRRMLVDQTKGDQS